MKIKFKAFTLMEIMIVVALIGILVGLGTPGYLRSRNKARQNACVTNLRMIENAADQYRIDYSLSLSEDTDITDFWPATAGKKDVSSYINKQLFCPADGIYVGGDNNSNGYAGRTNDLRANTSDVTIDANGYPHCVTAGNTIMYVGQGIEHSIEAADN